MTPDDHLICLPAGPRIQAWRVVYKLHRRLYPLNLAAFFFLLGEATSDKSTFVLPHYLAPRE